MTAKKDKPAIQDSNLKQLLVQSPVGETHKELSARDIFTGDEDFYEFMARQGQVQVGTDQPLAGANKTSIATKIKRFSTLQKILAFSIIILTAALLLYASLKPATEVITDIQKSPAAQQIQPPKVSSEELTQLLPQQTQKPQPSLPPTQPLSLKVAQDFYLQKDYNRAYAVYNQLCQNLPAGGEEESLRSFLQLKMALCTKQTQQGQDSTQASHLFREIAESRSPIIKALANYYMAFIEVQNNQFLKARARAYRTIALIDAVDLDKNVALSLQRDCSFLIAESITRYILSLCDADKDIPSQLWSSPTDVDLFADLNDTSTLNTLLNSGSEKLKEGLLGPQVQKIEHSESPALWSIVCYDASIEELLARFAANAGIDIVWAPGSKPGFEEEKNAIRKRAVCLYLPAATAQQVVAVASGCAGLLAHSDEKGSVNILNPDEYYSLSEHISLLGQEAISLWQRFLLTFYDDQHIPNAHFVLGLLYAQKGQVSESIAEHKLVANRYLQTHLAPLALLHSSKLKSNLRDYLGAREDLEQLVEQYPDSELSGQASLHLADVTMKAGLLHEASQLYSKVYNLGLSPQSQIASSLGAGKCFYEIKDYEAAAKWLTRYIRLARDQTSRDLYLAYLLLGKTNLALGKTKLSCEAFQYALSGKLSGEEYVETVTALVNAQIQQEHFIEALALINNIHPWQLSQERFIEILLLKSKILRAMGLVDKAIALLGDRAEYTSDAQLKAKISFELAKNYIAKGDLEVARGKLSEILVVTEPGPLAQEVALELAGVCLKLGESTQTVSICSQLLGAGPSMPIKQKTLETLATAYNQQKNYEMAALTLLGKWSEKESSNVRGTDDNRAAINQLPLNTQ